jgi:hypothetical protein
MAKVYDVVKRALSLIQVINPKQTFSASDMASAIMALNGMMIRWEADGVSVGWSPVADPEDQVHVPPEALDAVTYNLGIVMAPEYGVEPMPVVLDYATRTLAAVYRDVLAANPIINQSSGPAPANSYSFYNVWNDQYSGWPY